PIFHGDRPRVQQRLDKFSELAAVGRDVPTAVVVQVERRESKIGGQCGTVIVSVAAPLQITHAQAVHEQQDSSCRGGNRRAQRFASQRERLATAAQGHRNRKRVGCFAKVVAQYAVQRRKHRFAVRGGLSGATRWRHRSKQRVNASTGETRYAPDGLVYE